MCKIYCDQNNKRKYEINEQILILMFNFHVLLVPGHTVTKVKQVNADSNKFTFGLVLFLSPGK